MAKMSAWLRRSETDEYLLDFIVEQWGGVSASVIRELLPYLAARRSHDSRIGRRIYRLVFGPRKEPRKRPLWRIIRFLARLHLEEQVLVYLSRFPGIYPEEMARAYELLEMIRFDEFLFWQPGSRVSSRLEYFRVAQKIRNEHGITRPEPQGDCFNSFEHIARMEEDLRVDEPAEFLHQCLALKLIDEHHAERMYKSIRTHAQLISVDYDVSFYGHDDLRTRIYFAEAFTQIDASEPNWIQLRRFLAEPFLLHEDLSTLFGAIIPKENLDEALSCLLRYCIESIIIHYSEDILSTRVSTAVSSAVRLLLVRGARLQHRVCYEDGGYWRPSLLWLLTLGALGVDLSPTEFHRFVCCPIMPKIQRVKFDNRCPPRLICLAARVLANLGMESPIYEARLAIRYHSELQSNHAQRPLPIL